MKYDFNSLLEEYKPSSLEGVINFSFIDKIRTHFMLDIKGKAYHCKKITPYYIDSEGGCQYSLLIDSNEENNVIYINTDHQVVLPNKEIFQMCQSAIRYFEDFLFIYYIRSKRRKRVRNGVNINFEKYNRIRPELILTIDPYGEISSVYSRIKRDDGMIGLSLELRNYVQMSGTNIVYEGNGIFTINNIFRANFVDMSPSPKLVELDFTLNNNNGSKVTDEKELASFEEYYNYIVHDSHRRDKSKESRVLY